MRYLNLRIRVVCLLYLLKYINFISGTMFSVFMLSYNLKINDFVIGISACIIYIIATILYVISSQLWQILLSKYYNNQYFNFIIFIDIIKIFT
jgi:hypothetical protein